MEHAAVMECRKINTKIRADTGTGKDTHSALSHRVVGGGGVKVLVLEIKEDGQ